MRKAKCLNGHFFDLERFDTCPSCGAPAIEESGAFNIRDANQPPAPKTMPLQGVGSKPIGEPAPREIAPAPQTPLQSPSLHPEKSVLSPEGTDRQPEPQVVHPQSELAAAVEQTGSKAAPAMPKTVAYYDNGEVEPPVGWLVCIQGPCAGHAYECKTGRNHIGRNQDMDICIPEDATISRDTHAVIIYEPRNRVFFLQAGTSSGLTYLNDAMVFDHEEIHAYDRIELGKASFVFFPLCGEKFSWDDYMKKD